MDIENLIWFKNQNHNILVTVYPLNDIVGKLERKDCFSCVIGQKGESVGTWTVFGKRSMKAQRDE